MHSTDVQKETKLPQPQTDKIWVCLAWCDGDNMAGMERKYGNGNRIVFIANQTCNTTVTGSCCIHYSRIWVTQ